MPTAWSPDAFAERCRQIIATQCEHAAHRSLDLLTNDVLSSLGYGEGIAIFEAAVREWHGDGQPYPHDAAAAERAAIVAFLRSRDHTCADILAEQIEGGAGG